jgi:hypothetical protein
MLESEDMSVDMGDFTGSKELTEGDGDKGALAEDALSDSTRR